MDNKNDKLCKNVKSSSLFTAANAKRALLAQRLKRLLTYSRRKLQNVRVSTLEFLFEAAGVAPTDPVGLVVVLVVFFLISIAWSWSVLCALSDLAGLVQ